MMRRAFAASLLLAGIGVMLTGCGTYNGFVDPATTATPKATQPLPAGQTHLYSKPFNFYTALPDGRQILCVGINGATVDSAPSITCDWGDLQHLNKPAR